MLWLKRLKDSNNFAVLPRPTRLLLMGEVKPAEKGTKDFEAGLHSKPTKQLEICIVWILTICLVIFLYMIHDD